MGCILFDKSLLPLGREAALNPLTANDLLHRSAWF